jgi:NAD(P)-dependent dehydrogenase (short-subunit alcohol dehydrogenase family)/uncharacterized OB-fold protein
MTGPFPPPGRKNPLMLTRVPLLPPAARSRKAHLLTAAAAAGRFALPRCGGCGAFAYPVPEACAACLSADLRMVDAPAGGVLLSQTVAEVPADSYFRERGPWRVGLVRMDAGPTALVHLHPDCATGDAVRLTLMLDRAGQAVFHAAPKGTTDMTTDPQWHEMTAHPRHRRILVTDARGFGAAQIAAALKKAGAREVMLGLPEAWKPFDPRGLEGMTVLPLDMGSERSVADFVRDHGHKIEIVVNNADHPHPLAPATPQALREALEAVALGPHRLAAALAPVMAARGADGAYGAAAWVNVLSVHALAPSPAMAGYSAAHAAALALSHGVRAQLAAGGVRLANLFAGPLDSPGFQPLPHPKVSGGAVAASVLTALARGLEEDAIGDVARDLMQRLAENPKAVERDLRG